MGFLHSLSTVWMPRPMRAMTRAEYETAWWSGEPVLDMWISSLSAAGITVTPDLALALSAFHSGVTMIANDLATLPAQTFKWRDDGGKDRVKPLYGRGLDMSNGIGSLSYMLRWQPNVYQTACEFFVAMLAQFLMRACAYAEIVSGPSGFMEALLPRHPDRITPERLPSGRLRYKMRESAGGPRYLTQDEMFVVRDSLDGSAKPTSRVQYGANAIGTCLAAEQAAARFFKSGMTASMLATHPGEVGEEDEKALHASITRYAAGTEHSFGLMLVPDDIKIEKLAVEPEKAQMIQARDMGVREIARLLHIPGSKLGVKDTTTYASAVQLALDYVIGCLRPIAVMFEQAIQRDLILAKDTYFVEFKLEALLRGDFESQANYIEKLVRCRVLRPGTEARVILNMNPDAELDRISERDFQPGQRAATGTTSGAPIERAQLKGVLAMHDNALRCLKRERAAISKLATKHAADVDGWKQALRDFYGEHAGFVAQVMRLDPTIARGYAAQHGSTFETHGAKDVLDDAAYADWERCEADDLCLLGLGGIEDRQTLADATARGAAR